MGVSALRRVQVGKEATKFTAVPATYRLVGLNPGLQFKPVFEAIGGWTGGFVRTAGEYMTERSGTGKLTGPLLLDVDGLTPFVFGMHSFSKSGTAPYLYVFRQGINNAPTIATATWEYGDGTEIFQAAGGIVTDWTLNGRAGKSVEIDSNWEFGDISVTALGAFTTITPPTGTNEVQTLTITGTPTGGGFTLSFGGWTTAQIAYNANAAAVQAALDALPSIGAGNSLVAGGPLPAATTVTFIGALAGQDVPALTFTNALTGGTSPTVVVTTSTPGVAAAGINYASPDRKPPVVLTNSMQFFVDGVSVGVNLTAFSLKYTTGLNVMGKIDGTIAQNDISYKVPSSQATITLETSANQAALYADMESETRRAFRLANSAVNPTFAADWVGQVVNVSDLGDQDGITTLQFTIRDAWQASKLPDPMRVAMSVAGQTY